MALRRAVVPRPISGVRLITLISDFGLHDPYVGILKGRIVERAPGTPIIDLTHEITPFAPEEAGYWLYCCCGQFPAGTVHVAVVDPGVGSARAIVVLQAKGQLFIAPDNGLLGLVASGDVEARAYQVGEGALLRLGLAPLSATFHGRDVMAPLAAELASERLRADEVGPQHDLQPGRLQRAVARGDGSIHGVIAVIDRYGNALTTIPAASLGGFRRPRVWLAGRQLPLVRTYAEASAGECVALINSSSMLELAAREASAAQALNARAGQAVYVDETLRS
jgi:S-adenosylmethionine hydrolase